MGLSVVARMKSMRASVARHRSMAPNLLVSNLLVSGLLIALPWAAQAAKPPSRAVGHDTTQAAEQSSRDLQEQASQNAQWCQVHPERCVAQNNLRYAEVLRDAILAKWHPPAGAAADASCILDLRQAPGGRVTSAQAVEPCSFDEQGRRSIETAAIKAQPLPYEGYEQVFRPQLRLQMRAPDPDDDAKPSAWRRLRDRVDAIRDR